VQQRGEHVDDDERHEHVRGRDVRRFEYGVARQEALCSVEMPLST